MAFLKYRQNRLVRSLELVKAVSGAGTASRVVWVKNSGATTGWAGNSSKVVPGVVETMLADGLMSLTKTTSIVSAWTKILPCGTSCSSKKIAIKVNFNNSYGSGTSNNCYQDYCPTYQVVNALLDQLVSQKGIPAANINIYDTSRSFPDYFKNGISARFAGVGLNQYQGQGSSYTVKGAQLGKALVDADYLINMPLLRTHNMASVTLSFKNNLGSTTYAEGFHNAFFGSTLATNSLVELNSHPQIKQKTILIIDVALYGLKGGGPSCNGSCGQDSNFFVANSIFLSQDPVAVDSLMIDYLQSVRGVGWGTTANPRITYDLAARNGLGNFVTSCDSQSNCSFNYDTAVIELVRCENGTCVEKLNPTTGPIVKPTLIPTPTPTPILGDVNLDGRIDKQDARLLFSLYRSSQWSAIYAPDPDRDGRVTLLDFGWIVKNW